MLDEFGSTFTIGYNPFHSPSSTPGSIPMTDLPDFRPLPKHWRIHHRIPKDIDAELSDFSPLMRQLLYNRGITDSTSAMDFVNGDVGFPTEPLLLTGMREAVTRLHQAVTHQENVAIYGDYDADGVTSTALLVEFLSQLGLEARPYIPNRYDEGYGLNAEAMAQLAEEGVSLIITVDCGIRAIAEVTLANQLGMEVIVTDHHHPGSLLPPAVAVIDPRQEGDAYPEKNLAAVGLAYKLTQAYLEIYPQEDVHPEDWLDLVAIGTVADLTPLQGENRMLVRLGLEKIRHEPRQGIFSLARLAGIDLAKLDASHIGFGLGPRLNAAGRLDTAYTALALLTTDDLLTAGQLAQKLDRQNNHRQELTQKIREDAAARVLSQDPEALLFFAADPSFSEGVVGLAASRLAEAYYRPAIIAHQGERLTVASCRSIPEFHITRALDACADLLEKHGGHAAAAGFTVRNENIDALLSRLVAIAEEQLGSLELVPELFIDREIQLERLDYKYIPGILEDLHQLEPTGRGNPEPLFSSKNVAVRQARLVGREASHLKLTLQAGNNTYDGIAFRQGYWYADLPERIDIAYRFDVNDYMGRNTLQLNIKEIKASENESTD
jgi:single-stranded-DNA-specific exonuclease